jgi:hypothetical protein
MRLPHIIGGVVRSKHYRYNSAETQLAPLSTATVTMFFPAPSFFASREWFERKVVWIVVWNFFIVGWNKC